MKHSLRSVSSLFACLFVGMFVIALSWTSQAFAGDGATFVSETIPDNTLMTPSQAFTKTWTLKNSGTTTWTTGTYGYTLNFVSGSRMGSPA